MWATSCGEWGVWGSAALTRGAGGLSCWAADEELGRDFVAGSELMERGGWLGITLGGWTRGFRSATRGGSAAPSNDDTWQHLVDHSEEKDLGLRALVFWAFSLGFVAFKNVIFLLLLQ